MCAYFHFSVPYACLLCVINAVMLYQGNPFWRLVGNLLKTPDKKQIDCQHPKPILIDTGEMKQPYDWAVSCNIRRHTSPIESS